MVVTTQPNVTEGHVSTGPPLTTPRPTVVTTDQQAHVAGDHFNVSSGLDGKVSQTKPDSH